MKRLVCWLLNHYNKKDKLVTVISDEAIGYGKFLNACVNKGYISIFVQKKKKQ
jgi:hypothetical protein